MGIRIDALDPAANVQADHEIPAMRSGATVKLTAEQIATFVVALVTDSAPATLDTLNELAEALGDDPNFATTVTNALAGKVAASALQTTITDDDTKVPTSGAIVDYVGPPPVRLARVSASGTTVDFTGLPADVVEIDIAIDGLSLNGNDTVSLWLGDAGGIETTGYANSSLILVSGSAVSGATVTTSFRFGSAGATNVYSGNIRLRRSDSATNLWVCDGLLALENVAGCTTTAGTKALSAALTQIRLGSTGGSATFDAGGIQVSYRRA